MHAQGCEKESLDKEKKMGVIIGNRIREEKNKKELLLGETRKTERPCKMGGLKIN